MQTEYAAPTKAEAEFSDPFTDQWVKHCLLPTKDSEPNQWSFLEQLGRGEKRSLALVVSYGGSKTWRVIWYVNSKPKTAKLGTYPAMSIANARKAAKAYDPVKEIARKDAGTFKEVAEDFVKRHVDRKGLRSKREIERQLRVYVLPRWKDRAMFDISRRDVHTLLDDIADKHGARQADAVLATVRKLMNWFMVRDENYRSPIVRGMKQAEYKPRDRWLSNDEIKAVWSACDHDDLYRPYGALIRLMLLTGQRREKLATMKWSDIDANGVWTIRRAEREKGAPNQLTLSRMARDIIAAVPRLDGNPFVFTGGGQKAFNSWSQRKAEIDQLLPDMPHWVHHDLRRSCRKLLTRRRVETEIAERLLGHAIVGVQAVYDDPREYGPRVDQALEAVASEIALIVDGPSNDKIARIGSRAASVASG